MKRKELFTAFIGLCFVLSILTLPLTPETASGEVITLKFAHQNPPKGRTTIKIIDAYIDKVRAVTKGKLKIVVYPAQSLIKDREMVTGIETGIADMSWTPLGYFAGRFPLTTVTTLPFMALNSGAKMSMVLQELYETMPEVQREYRSMKVLFFHTSDAYRIVTSKKPVRNMDDAKGLKLRVMGAYPIKAAKELGISPLFMTMPQVYESGEKGVLDGATLPWAAVATFKLYEVYNYWTDAPLWGANFMVFMNKDKWNSLPPDIQKEISSISGMKAAEWAGNAGFGPDVQNDVETRVKAEGQKYEKVSLDPGELEKWKKIGGQPIWNEWVNEMNKKGLPGQKVLDTTMSLMEKYQ